MGRHTLVAVPLVAALACAGAAAGQATPPEAAVRSATADFVDALNDLDWDRLGARFDADATAFLPLPDVPARVQGRDAIVDRFRNAFARVPRTDGPPYLRNRPQDVDVRMIDDAAAVVTFHLGPSTNPARRTLVFAHSAEGWRIVHLHASAFDPPPGSGEALPSGRAQRSRLWSEIRSAPACCNASSTAIMRR